MRPEGVYNLLGLLRDPVSEPFRHPEMIPAQIEGLVNLRLEGDLPLGRDSVHLAQGRLFSPEDLIGLFLGANDGNRPFVMLHRLVAVANHCGTEKARERRPVAPAELHLVAVEEPSLLKSKNPAH